MCIVALALNAHPRWRLIIAANRDEYHERPTAPLARWLDSTGLPRSHPLIAGRDLRSGGTWLGVREGDAASARIVLVTNYRVPGYPQPNRPSRGGLVTALLEGADPRRVDIAPYNPFNLLCLSSTGAYALSNYQAGNHPAEHRAALGDGIHGISNGGLDTPWPKTRQLTADLARWLEGPASDFALLFAALAASTPLAPHDAGWDPHGPDPEPRLSPVFIRDSVYGTRCSTLVAIGPDGAGTIIERSFAPSGAVSGEVSLSFAWPAPLANRAPAP